jgi:DNA-binding NarL/FixJ family response regulator
MLNLQENQSYQRPTNPRLPTRERELGLSLRHREVLMARAMGKTQGQIAEDLRISQETVKRHVATADYRLGVNGVIDAISMAMVRGELDSQSLASQYDFEKYDTLTGAQKNVLNAMREMEEVSIKTLAERLRAKPQTIKNVLSKAYRRLGIPKTISQAWLFAILMPAPDHLSRANVKN